MQKQNITISLNGESYSFTNEFFSIDKLLENEGYAEKTVAVALNGHFVPKSTYNKHVLKEGDEIDIVAPMQGG